MQLASKKVLVTGGSGFIGTNLIQHLLDKGADVRNFDRSEPADSKHAAMWIRGQVGDLTSFKAAMKEVEPDYIVHLAARTDLSGRGMEDYQDNISGANNIIKMDWEG